jgi:2,3-bisphosphoglycerate-dependent phosphoglycerate mutase
MQLYFIRHAQSENNAHLGDEHYHESEDPELTEIAYAQVEYLARFLGENQKLAADVDWNPQNCHGFGLTHIYTSLMVRAVATATPAAHAMGLPLTAWPEIHETGGIFSRKPGDEATGLPGKSRAFFEVNYPDLILPDWLDERGWWQSRPFETYEARLERAAYVWSTLLDRHGDQEGQSEQRVALVSHGGFFMYLLTTALEINMRRNEAYDHDYWFLMNNCGITRLDISNDHVLIAYVNRTDFLPADLIT